MPRFRAVLAALLLSALPAAAQAAPALWEVSDADSKIWLFGSMHLLPAGTHWRTPLFDDTLARTDKVYFEADVGPWGILGAIIWMLKSGVRTAQDPWLPTLTPEQTQQLTAAITPLGLKLKDLGAYEPWLAAQVIAEKALAQPAATPSETAVAPSVGGSVAGADFELEGQLPAERKAYFETVAQQLTLMSSIPRAQQIEGLMQTVAELAGTSVGLGDMATQWASGDLDGLGKLIAADPDSRGAMADIMLFGRNRSWIPTIETMLAQNQQDLIVVGAAHLVGNGSVIDLLGKAGFTVKRIQ